jgi:hypothetical protein
MRIGGTMVVKVLKMVRIEGAEVRNSEQTFF